jgi:hypothetical protein
MSNNLLTISMITNEGLMVLENDCVLSSKFNRQYADEFAISGAKIGYTVNVRKPPRYIGTFGPALNVEDTNETYMPVTLTTQFHVDVQFNTADMATSMDLFSERVVKPAAAAVANRVDSDGALFAYQATGLAVGTPGVAPSSTTPFLQAGAVLAAEGMPKNAEKCVVLDPFSMAAAVDGVKGLFNPQAVISDMATTGLVAKKFLGFDWYQDQNIISATVGAGGGSPVYNSGIGSHTALLASGWSDGGSIGSSGWSNTTAVLRVGDVITLGTATTNGVFGVNPQNRLAYGSNRLRQFVVKAPPTPSTTLAQGTFTPTYLPNSNNTIVSGGTYTSNGSGQLEFYIAESVISAGQFQNVTAAPVTASSAITILGTGGAVSPQGLAFHKNFMALAFADLDLPGGVDMASRAVDREQGISIRMVRQYTINNDALPARFDVLYGYAPLYRSMGVRVCG